jgi:arginyl-tRNA synthetase
MTAMEEFLTVLKENLGFWLVGLYAVSESLKKLLSNIEFFDEWLKKRGVKTKRMIEREKERERLKNTEKAIEEIKDTSKKNVEMFLEHERQTIDKIGVFKNEIVEELSLLRDKVNEQREEMDKNIEANNKTDCAMLRDRIGSGMRYFSKNVGADGNIHISLSDWENMNALFQEYFSKHGNGAFRKMYEEEFTHFIIDR